MPHKSMPQKTPSQKTPPQAAGRAPEPLAPDLGAPHDPELSDTERDRIRRRAHALWREAGYPQGRDREHWEQAKLQVLKQLRSY